VQPGELPFREGDRGRGDASVVARGEQLADAPIDLGRVAVARDEDEHRDEAVELVAPRQHADARPLAELQDGEGVRRERIHLELEHLVARVGLEDVGQRLARVARRVEAAARQHRLDLAAHQWDRRHRARVGVVGEQSDDAHLAGERAVRGEALDAHIVHVAAPVDARAQVRLGDDDRVRPQQELADFLRGGDEVGAAPEHAHIRVAQDAEPAFVGALQRAVAAVAAVDVFAQTEEGETLAREPFDERPRLAERRRIDRELRLAPRRRHRAGTRPHRVPVLHRRPHVAQRPVEPGGELCPVVGSRQPVDVDGDQALARPRLRVRRAVEGEQTPAPHRARRSGSDGRRGARRHSHRRARPSPNRAGTAYRR
jgi:hypothetical protein